jgi:hypothetical protein
MRPIAFLLVLCAFARADTVVLRDRTILDGDAAKAGDKLTVAGETVPMSHVILWEGADGTPKHAPSFRDHLDACRLLADRERVSKCMELLPKAVEAGAKDVAWDLLTSAGEAGLDLKRTKEWRAKLGRLGKSGTTDVKVPGREVLADVLVKRATACLDDGQDMRGWQLLRAALDYDPKHKEARYLLEDIAPEFWRVGDATKGDDVRRIWLDWHIDVIQEGMRAVGRRQPDIQRARSNPRWNKKLHGAQTQEIVFITALTDSHIVSLCTKYAWLSCKALDRMFATKTPLRDDNLPLVIWFFENKREYLEVSQGGQRGFLAMTAGYYSPSENISRFFWIPNNERSVRDTFVHELTHHWIQRRDPRISFATMAQPGERAAIPGYWVVEGFATFIEEGRYDIRKSTWSHFNPTANSLDIVADLSKQGKLIRWEKLYGLNQIEFRDPEKLEQGKVHATAHKHYGINPQPINQIRLFYEQSAATCHFLYWGENGKYRDALLDYVTNYYSGKEAKTGIKAAFGLSPEELGKKVEKYAISVILEGSRPDRS